MVLFYLFIQYYAVLKELLIIYLVGYQSFDAQEVPQLQRSRRQFLKVF